MVTRLASRTAATARLPDAVAGAGLYDCAISGSKGAYHSDIDTRAELQKELPAFYEFLSEPLPGENDYHDCYAKP